MCKFGNKMLITFHIVLPLLFIASCDPGIEDRVKAFHRVANSGDTEKLLSFYADDVSLELVGTPIVLEGKDALRKPIREQYLLNGHLTFTDVRVEGNVATFKVKEQNDLYEAAGIDAVYYEYDQITFENGLIKSEKASITPRSAEAVGKYRRSFVRWASKTQSRKWNKLQTEGITEENVSQWIDITRQWREETKQKEK